MTSTSKSRGSTASEVSERVIELRDRRNDLGLSQADVAKQLATFDRYGIAKTTLESYLTRWETGRNEPEEEDLDAYADALDAIEAAQNETHPACSASDCPNDEPVFKPQFIDDEPYCLVCYYSREVEPIGKHRDSDSRDVEIDVTGGDAT